MNYLFAPHHFSCWHACIMAALGACFGSFAALIIFRLPRGEPIALSRSRCFSCMKQLRVWHNIPLLSWVILRGRCGYCHAFIGWRSLIIEFIFSICLLALYIKFGIGMALIERFFFVFLLVCLAYIDLDTYSLPYSLLWWLLGLGLVSTFIYSISPSRYFIPHEKVSFLKMM